MSSDRVLITDFGLSKIVNQSSMMQTVCGTPIYLGEFPALSRTILLGQPPVSPLITAPEILTQLESSQAEGYGKAVDLWSLGVILYVMCVGYPPFQGETREKLFETIKAGSLLFKDSEWLRLSGDVRDLISKLLDHDPKTRPDVDQALAHRWLQDQVVINRWKEVTDNHGSPSSSETLLIFN